MVYVENFAVQCVLVFFTFVILGGTIWRRCRGHREVNKYKFLEVKDSVLVPSLRPAPDVTCNTE